MQITFIWLIIFHVNNQILFRNCCYGGILNFQILFYKQNTVIFLIETKILSKYHAFLIVKCGFSHTSQMGKPPTFD